MNAEPDGFPLNIKNEDLPPCLYIKQENDESPASLVPFIAIKNEPEDNSFASEYDPLSYENDEERIENKASAIHLQIKEENKELPICIKANKEGSDSLDPLMVVKTELKETDVKYSGECSLYQSGDGSVTYDKEVNDKDTNNQTRKKGFVCSECGKFFIYRSYMIRHIKMHTGKRDRPLKCNECGKEFAYIRDLETHIRTHTGEKPFGCNECEKAFCSKSDLTKHIRVHNGEKPFTCSVCGKAFHQKTNLTRHIRTHTGERPFRCFMCEKAFSAKAHLIRHTRLHTGEKPFLCNECGASFSYQYQLSSHMNSHSVKKSEEI